MSEKKRKKVNSKQLKQQKNYKNSKYVTNGVSKNILK